MNPPTSDLRLLAREHQALMRHYGQAQLRCSELVRAQAAEIASLRAEAMRLRAAVMVRDTALAWAPGQIADHAADQGEDPAILEASLVAADLVICQTGCLSHGAYWRVQDHCRRMGKPCVLVEQPDALRIVRINKPTAREAPEATKRLLTPSQDS